MIHIGFSKGQSIDIPLLHTIVAAQTRYGKSTTIRAMMQYVPEDYKIVCLDVKDPRDFEGVGVEVPIYIENKTDPLMLKQLLEQESHLWLRKEFPELIDLCKEGDTFEKVYERVNKRMEEKVHPVVKDRLKVLQLLLKSLVESMAMIELSDTLELPGKKNVMNLSKAPSEIKQLAVYSTVKWILTKLRNVVLVIDELPDFAPQGYRTPSKSIIGEAIRKGGAKGIWLWLSGQTMTGVDKGVLKQAMVWILGHQREINEAKRTLDQIPFKTGLKVEDIMTLPVGSFVVCTDEGAYITYVQPEGLDTEPARRVSLGQLSVNDVSELLRGKEVDDDLVWKERYEEERRKREECEKEFARQVERLSDRKAEEKVNKLKEEFGEAKRVWEKDASQMNKDYDEAHKTIKELESQLEAFKNFKGALAALLPTPTAATMPATDIPSEIIVSAEQPALVLEKKTPPLKLAQDTLEGRVAIVYGEGKLPEKAFTKTELNKILEARFGTKEFPGNLPVVCNKFVAWGYFEKVQAGKRFDYRVKMSPQKAEEKGLLKEVEAE